MRHAVHEQRGDVHGRDVCWPTGTLPAKGVGERDDEGCSSVESASPPCPGRAPHTLTRSARADRGLSPGVTLGPSGRARGSADPLIRRSQQGVGARRGGYPKDQLTSPGRVGKKIREIKVGWGRCSGGGGKKGREIHISVRRAGGHGHLESEPTRRCEPHCSSCPGPWPLQTMARRTRCSTRPLGVRCVTRRAGGECARGVPAR